MNAYRKLATVDLDRIDTIASADGDTRLDMDSPAMAILTDFERRARFLLEQNTPIDEAIEIMNRTHVKQLLVIDSREAFRGVISKADLLSVKVARAGTSTGLKREDLTVAHVMTRREDLRAITLRSFETACIGDVVATLESQGDQYALVVDQDKGTLRGLVSASDIARALHRPFQVRARAHTFAEICRAVQH